MADSLDEEIAEGVAARQKALAKEELRRKEALEALNASMAETVASQQTKQLEKIYNLPSPAPDKQERVQVPDLRGQPPVKAQIAIEKLGLKVYVTKEKSDQVATATVLTIQPTPGT